LPSKIKDKKLNTLVERNKESPRGLEEAKREYETPA
jgi:hypothetical protein